MIKFSIITVTKNAAATLERSIKSVATQHYSSLEYIIVDGASSDATAAIVDRYRNVVTRFVSEPDRGIYDAMNKGLDLASGDFVYFLGADDYFVDADVLPDVAAFLEAHPDCDFAYGGISIRFPDGRTQESMPPLPEAALSFQVCGCLPHQASFTSRRAFALAGRFDTRYRIAGDYEWFLRVLAQSGLVIQRFERTVASYRIDGVSSRLTQSLPEVYAIQNSFPLYQDPEWLRRRIRIFQRELLSQRKRGVLLGWTLGLRAWLAQTSRLLRLVLIFPLVSQFVPINPGRWSKQRLLDLEQKLFEQRLANDLFERELLRHERDNAGV